MAGLNPPSQNRDVNEESDVEMETLSTGLENFDQAFEQQGIRIGTLIGVFSDPVAPGDVLAANMIANRPAYYYTFTRSEKHVERDMKNISNVDLDKTHIHSISSETPAKTLTKKISETDYPRGVTIIVDTVNSIEGDGDEYTEFLQQLQKSVEEHDGLGVLLGMNPNEEPDNRWKTERMCDTVIEVYHRMSDEVITDYLALQKLYYGQTMVDEEARVFELTNNLDIDIATSRNISP